MPIDRIHKHDWLTRNVLPHLPVTNRTSLDDYLKHPANLHPKPSIGYVRPDRNASEVKPEWVIANEVRDFLLASTPPELWAWFCAYDHVVLAQLFGPMIELPEGIPMYTHDLRALVDYLPDDTLPKQGGGLHDALEDARWVKQAHAYATREGNQ